MCRKASGWCVKMRSCKVNIWDRRKMRPDKWMISLPYTETKFTRPPWLTRFGFPALPRSDPKTITPDGESKYCNMSRLHEQDAKRPHGVNTGTTE
mmetsp:Transcript_100943/g.324034  ORF Transcript_100943/g.324034 Transcript_100943/m.324034 type:complete len:95 (+) Transcript_100943:75-359(+)